MSAAETIFFDATEVISVAGNDAIDFLNNLTISDITIQTENSIRYNAICNPKGRIIYSFFIKKSGQTLLLATHQSLATELSQFLNMRRFRAQVEVKSTQYKLVLLEHTTVVENNNFPMLDIFESTTDQSASIFSWIIETRFPWITAATSEKHIPQDVNLDQLNVISFNKGCYPGQEIVARLHYLGKSKKALLLLTYSAEQALENGTSVTLEDKTQLRIVSESKPEKSDWICQAVGPSDYSIDTIPQKIA